MDYKDFNEKRVLLTVSVAGGENKQIEGKVVSGTPLGLLIKPKGKTQPELIEAAAVVSIELAPDKPKALKAKSLKLVDTANVKAHLLERHAIQVGWVNSVTDEAAEEYHNSLDHKELDLGHYHTAEKTEQEKAIEQAEAKPAEEPVSA